MKLQALIEKLITTAIRQWQSYAPTERKGNKLVQAEFDQVLAAMRKKLYEHRQNSSEAKQKLIELEKTPSKTSLKPTPKQGQRTESPKPETVQLKGVKKEVCE